MLRPDLRVGVIVVGLILAIAASAGLAIRHIGNSSPNAGVAEPASRAASEEASSPEDDSAASFDRYAVIPERDIFKPLVASAAPKVNVPDVPSPTAKRSQSPAMPQSPTEDLAMTGVVQAGGRLRVLITNVKTHESTYAAEGDTAFDFRVVKILAREVRLSKDGEQYTLKMGEKEIAEESAEASRKTFSASREPSRPSSPTTPAGPRPPRRGGFRGGNIGDWERRLEEAHASGRISDEQYERAKRYIQMRRQRGY